jgi:hypothetical protein
LVDALVITEAKENPSYKLYTGYLDEFGCFQKPVSYTALRAENFSLVKLLKRDDALNGDFGSNYNLYFDVYRFYVLSHPSTPYNDIYEKRFVLFLEAVGEYYDGLEVRPVIEEIINEAYNIKGKGKQRTYIKSRMKEVFHIEGTNRPYWIQEAEWPMGKKSPMQYISKTRKGEEHLYLFRDVDTGEERTIVQWW